MNDEPNTILKDSRYKSYFRLGWYALVVLTVLLLFYPVNIGLLRVFFLLAIPSIFCGATFLLWKKKRIRWIPISLLCLFLLPFILPGRKVDRDKLNSRYIQNLNCFNGVRFIWGGENCFGIDCSGLARKGLINANLAEGFFRANPSCMRKAVELWWFDCSARALKSEYRAYTSKLFQTESINKLDHAKLKPGDLAVTMDGIHVMVYLGDKKWIEADPGIGKVVMENIPTDNHWFDMPVQILRWRQFDQKE